jgi:hypothetical protein
MPHVHCSLHAFHAINTPIAQRCGVATRDAMRRSGLSGMSRDFDINLKHYHNATHYNVSSESGTIMLSTDSSACLTMSQVGLANDVLESIKVPIST